jgi:hypothetical protein
MGFREVALAVTFRFGIGALGLGAVACSTPESLAGQGGECFLATDCQPGLVCVPKKDGTRACSSDLSTIEHTPFAPGEAGVAADAGEAGAASPEAGEAGASTDSATGTEAGASVDSAPSPEAGANDSAQPGSDAPVSQPGDASAGTDAVGSSPDGTAAVQADGAAE